MVMVVMLELTVVLAVEADESDEFRMVLIFAKIFRCIFLE